MTGRTPNDAKSPVLGSKRIILDSFFSGLVVMPNETTSKEPVVEKKRFTRKGLKKSREAMHDELLGTVNRQTPVERNIRVSDLLSPRYRPATATVSQGSLPQVNQASFLEEHRKCVAFPPANQPEKVTATPFP